MNRILCVVNDTALSGTDFGSEHGLAFWIETAHGSVLFDTGQTAAVLSHNLALLGLKPQNLSAVVLSHAHYDHTGGMQAILSSNSDLILYAHADIFRSRFSLKNGIYKSIGLTLSKESLENRIQLHLSDAPTQILPNLWTTGEIVQRPEQEGRSATHFIKTGNGWTPDPYRDDLSLVLKTQPGFVLICGCCHAGLLNTLYHVERTFKEPITAVVGGTHLMTAEGEYLSYVIDILEKRYHAAHFYLNHCTGEKAIQELARVFPGRVKTFPAGAAVNFE